MFWGATFRKIYKMLDIHKEANTIEEPKKTKPKQKITLDEAMKMF